MQVYSFRSATQLRSSHASAAACPKRLSTSNGGNENPTVRSGKCRSGTSLPTCTLQMPWKWQLQTPTCCK